MAQAMQVPEVLPATATGQRPVPTFAGVSIMPLSKSLYSSTLSQLALSASFAAPMEQGPEVQVRCVWGLIIPPGTFKPSYHLSCSINTYTALVHHKSNHFSQWQESCILPLLPEQPHVDAEPR